MKKIFAGILSVLFLLLSVSCVYADSTEFQSSLANSIERSAQEWMADDTSRALLTVLLLFDLEVQEKVSVSDYQIGDSIVCKNEGVIMIGVCGKNDTLIVLYRPDIAYAKYMFGQKYDIDTLKNSFTLMTEVAYMNSYQALQNVLDGLENLFNQ